MIALGVQIVKSFKSGFDCVNTSMNTVTSAETMCLKSNRRAAIMSKKTAMKANNTPLQFTSKTREHLQPWCEEMTENERSMMHNYSIVQTNSNTFLVVKMQKNNGSNSHEPIEIDGAEDGADWETE